MTTQDSEASVEDDIYGGDLILERRCVLVVGA